MGSLWQDEFEMFELDELIGQRGDSAFTKGENGQLH